MKPVIQITEQSERLSGTTAVTVGKFDGVHMGHRKLLEAVCAGKEQGHLACVLSFLPKPEDGRNIIYTKEEQRILCEEIGADILAEYTLDVTMRELSPERFVKEILCEKLNAKVVVTGEDFRFGKDRAGDVALLQKLAAKYGFKTVCVPKVETEGDRISSTRIRELLSAGKIEEANGILGQPYFVYGKVEYGKQLGRTIGFPTINVLPPAEKLLPAYGVYMTRTKVGDTWYSGITNVGSRPTVEDYKNVSVETYLMDFDGDIYGQYVKIEFLRFLRSEQKFESVEALKQAIQKDIKESFAKQGKV